MPRGDIWSLKPLRDSTRHDQQGPRYAVVVQTEALDALSTVIAAPTSISAPASTLHPEVTIRGRATKVLVEQIRAIDRSRLARKVGRCDPGELEEIDDTLRAVLDLS